jgi:hypothetical protein
MNLPRSVADVLSDHVVLEVECIARMYANPYVPRLQCATGLRASVHQQLGLPTVPLAKISNRFTDAVHRLACEPDVPWVDGLRACAELRSPGTSLVFVAP